MAQERKVLSLSERALESKIYFLRVSLCFGFWLQIQLRNEEKNKKLFKLGSSVNVSNWAEFQLDETNGDHVT